VILEALRSSDGVTVFAGEDTVVVTSESSSGTGQQVEIPIVYTGPRAQSIVIAPRDTALVSGTIAYRVTAFDSLGNVVTQFITLTFEAPQAFFLLVTEPENQTVVFTRNIRLTGKTGLGALVSVNGVSIGVDAQGAFTTILTLDPGPNIIDVVSTSPDGQVLDTVLAVIYRA